MYGLILHCVTPACEGGVNQLLDHELAYIALHDENPAFTQVLMSPDVMTIPARVNEDGSIARVSISGPVFSFYRQHIHMRYTARTRSIEWQVSSLVDEARHCLDEILENSQYKHLCQLQSGMGVICNNVLHDRSGFTDSDTQKRLLYRARYYDHVRLR